jgi:hypothetical protein
MPVYIHACSLSILNIACDAFGKSILMAFSFEIFSDVSEVMDVLD